MCVIFCGTYALSCACTLSSAFFLLMLGRFLGGVSTALLLSTFEAWMVAEHNRKGFPADWLPRTFALATFGNGIVAVAAGITANLLADPVGSEAHHPVRPFMLAIGVLGFTGVMLDKTWSETVLSEGQEDDLASGGNHDDAANCVAGLRPIVRERKVRERCKPLGSASDKSGGARCNCGCAAVRVTCGCVCVCLQPCTTRPTS
jgi:MFS family permease